MKFLQNNPLVDFRNNLILSALVEIDHLERLSRASMSLSRALEPFREPEALLELVNQFAYKAIDHVVPDFIADSVREEFEDMPIDAEEVEAVLNKPIGSALHML